MSDDMQSGEDPIVAEIRAIREAIAARFNYDLRAIVSDAQRRDAQAGTKRVRLLPRRPAEPIAVKRPQPQIAPN